jgi:hypothetical protein
MGIHNTDPKIASVTTEKKICKQNARFIYPLGCSVAQMVVRWLAVRQARVRISARHPKEVPPTQPAAMKIWRRAPANVMSE